MIFHILSLKYFEESFGEFFCPPASNVNTKFSTFCLFMFIVTFQSLVKFVVWSFVFKIVIFSWVVEFLENILAFSLKQDLVYSHKSLAEERQLDPRPQPEWSYKIESVCPSFCPSFRMSVRFLGIGSSVFFWNFA